MSFGRFAKQQQHKITNSTTMPRTLHKVEADTQAAPPSNKPNRSEVLTQKRAADTAAGKKGKNAETENKKEASKKKKGAKSKTTKEAGKKKPKKDANMPKGAKSAYFFYQDEKAATLKAKTPGSFDPSPVNTNTSAQQRCMISYNKHLSPFGSSTLFPYSVHDFCFGFLFSFVRFFLFCSFFRS